MADKSQHVVDKSHFFLLFWDLSDTIWDLYVRSWDLSDKSWDLSYTSWDLSDTSWDLYDLCVGQVPKKKNLGFVHHELGFVTQVRRTSPIKKNGICPTWLGICTTLFGALCGTNPKCFWHIPILIVLQGYLFLMVFWGDKITSRPHVAHFMFDKSQLVYDKSQLVFDKSQLLADKSQLVFD